MPAAAAPEMEVERRAYERIEVEIFGRCLLENGMEIPCQAINISPGDVGLIAAHQPALGETVIVYLDHVGRLTGNVVRQYDGGFAITIDATPNRREKLAARVEWLKAHGSFEVSEDRSHARMEPKETNSQITLADGRSYPVEILDISLSGAAVKCEVKPAVASHVSLAGMQGQVVRHFAEGIAIQFAMETTRQGLFNSFGD